MGREEDHGVDIMAAMTSVVTRPSGAAVPAIVATMFEQAKKLLREWFLANFHVAASKGGISAAEQPQTIRFSLQPEGCGYPL